MRGTPDRTEMAHEATDGAPFESVFEIRNLEKPLGVGEDRPACWRKFMLTAKSKTSAAYHDPAWWQISLNFSLGRAYCANKTLLLVEQRFEPLCSNLSAGKGGVVLPCQLQKHPEIQVMGGWEYGGGWVGDSLVSQHCTHEATRVAVVKRLPSRTVSSPLIELQRL